MNALRSTADPIGPPTKGDLARREILDAAVDLAAADGLAGVTIGALAERTGRSKSGLFAHVRSKEELEVAVVERAEEQFLDEVARPGLRSPRGEPRVRAIVERWLAYAAQRMPSGCLFVAAAVELDDRPGPVRDRFVRGQQDWLELLATVFRSGVTEGHFRADADPAQFAHDVYAIMLGFHHAARLMRDPVADERARHALETLLASVRTPAAPTREAAR